MVIELVKEVQATQTRHILSVLEKEGLTGYLTNAKAIVVPVKEDSDKLRTMLKKVPGVSDVIPIHSRYPLVSREYHPENTVVSVNGHLVGASQPTIMAGPCSVETQESIIDIARGVKKAGGHVLRGGAFKPRSSPYSFQGHGAEGLKMLAEARAETGLPVISEVMSPDTVELVAAYVDILQVGARSMQNYPLLKAVGQSQKPVLLKRGLSATIEEWLLAAEYILGQGNTNVILCERGIRTFENATRNTMDLNAVPVVQKLTHLPVLVDPSHGVGTSEFVPALARAGIAAGAAGVLVEVHSNPAEAWSDGAQTINLTEFQNMAEDISLIYEALAQKYHSAKLVHA
ncbi:3-deoxy-7-phosphoheptulonate synthase [Alicyclobacillus sp. SO9]|uniref:3-deoxy-7-phosphoheptulonate synthase n=1 Tax=Alicyclobacillus sp. SO9 TaxID=2665646 RepID=UPI0018E7DD68|nr:3-deoxy-7-phosphoheptulonate synthase [Alicyclobacillus sp. SO9]QQE79856.1 3-deoxy-7-phosphoheptulonate synthase [Alicyclobacillus sp. SO9]